MNCSADNLEVWLSHLCKGVGFTGKGLSARCGWHPAETTRIQKSAVLPSDLDMRTWCAVRGVDDQAPRAGCFCVRVQW